MITYSELVARVAELERENLKIKKIGFDVVYESRREVLKISEELEDVADRLRCVRDNFLEWADVLLEIEACEHAEEAEDGAIEAEELAEKLRHFAYQMAARSQSCA